VADCVITGLVKMGFIRDTEWRPRHPEAGNMHICFLRAETNEVICFELLRSDHEYYLSKTRLEIIAYSCNIDVSALYEKCASQTH
jgi:hypothetical protein